MKLIIPILIISLLTIAAGCQSPMGENEKPSKSSQVEILETFPGGSPKKTREPMEGRADSMITTYYETGVKESQWFIFSDSGIEQSTSWFPNGKVNEKYYHEPGVLTEDLRFDRNGNRIKEHRRIGDSISQQFSFHANGVIHDVYTQLQKKELNWYAWHDNGRLMIEADIINDRFTEYHRNGQKMIEGPFEKGLVVSPENQYWDDQGNSLTMEEFVKRYPEYDAGN